MAVSTSENNFFCCTKPQVFLSGKCVPNAGVRNLELPRSEEQKVFSASENNFLAVYTSTKVKTTSFLSFWLSETN
jgi:hypothetical protein